MPETSADDDAVIREYCQRRLRDAAADISHDMKNILNPLSLQLELLRKRIDRGDREAALRSIAEMRQVIRDGVDLVDRLSSAADTRRTLEEASLANIVAIAVDLARIRRGSEIDVCFVPEPTARIRGRAADAVAIVEAIVAHAAMPARVSIGSEHGRSWMRLTSASDEIELWFASE